MSSAESILWKRDVAIARAFTFARQRPPVAQSRVDPWVLDTLAEHPLPMKTASAGNVLQWTGMDALLIVEYLWKHIARLTGTKETFAQHHSRDFQLLKDAHAPICVERLYEDSVMPTKTRALDVGYDVALIRTVATHGSDFVLFGTGLKVKPPDGFYIEIIARSSLFKSGWGLANSVGVIDPTYRGELLVALVKLTQEARDLQLPCVCVQLVLREQFLTYVKEVDRLDPTPRGSGGFGSTGSG